MIPDPVIEQHSGVFVVRDDLIAGGTKRRILPPLLTGADEFIYASPAYGYAQVALAHAAAAQGVRATVFTAKRKVLHPRTQEARAAGAKIVLVPTGYLSNVQAKARALQAAWPGAAFHAVQVGKAPQIGRARLWVAPEQFEDDAKTPPPFPSCSNYDAKAWRFIQRHATPGALFWNVAA